MIEDYDYDAEAWCYYTIMDLEELIRIRGIQAVIDLLSPEAYKEFHDWFYQDVS